MCALAFLITCSPGGSETEGVVPVREPVGLVSGQPRLTTFVLDAENAYWLNSGVSGSVRKLSRQGGLTTVLHQGSLDGASRLWLDRGTLYFERADGVASIPVTGGVAQTVVGSPVGVSSFAVVGGAMYWFDREPAPAGGSGATPPPSNVARKLELPNGPLGRFETPFAGSAAPDAKTAIVAGPDALYSHDGRAVLRIPLDGSPVTRFPTTLFGQPTSPFVADADYIYALAPDGIDRQPTTGGDVTRLTSAEGPMSIAVDGAYVYFADRAEGGRVARIAKNGGRVSTMAKNLAGITSLTVDATHVWWVNVTVAILRVPK